MPDARPASKYLVARFFGSSDTLDNGICISCVSQVEDIFQISPLGTKVGQLHGLSHAEVFIIQDYGLDGFLQYGLYCQ